MKPIISNRVSGQRVSSSIVDESKCGGMLDKCEGSITIGTIVNVPQL
jgi:hypothetical protein